MVSRSASTWAQQAYVKASNTEGSSYWYDPSGDKFGSYLSLIDDGNTLAVGAYLEDSGATGINGYQDDNSVEDSGAVYLY